VEDMTTESSLQTSGRS